MPGEGSTYRRADGLWVAQISQGPRTERRLVRRYAHSKSEAQAKLAVLRLESGHVDRRTTVGAYLRAWLEGPGRTVLKASTWETYELTIRRQLEPAFRGISLAALTPEHVEAMVAQLARTMTPKGIRNVLSVLGRILAVAERRGQIARNPARFVEPPRITKRRGRPMTAEEGRRIRAAVVGDRLEALYVVTLAAGLRQAEVLGLRWEDVDTEAGTIRIAGSLDRVGGQYVMVETKTDVVATLALPEFAIAALRDHRARQLEERVAAGVPTRDGLVFVSPQGRPINGGWLSHRWRVISRAAGIDRTFHELRHGHTDILIDRKVHPKVISERDRHSTITQTMDRYGHVTSEQDRLAAQELQEALG